MIWTTCEGVSAGKLVEGLTWEVVPGGTCEGVSVDKLVEGVTWEVVPGGNVSLLGLVEESPTCEE